VSHDHARDHTRADARTQRAALAVTRAVLIGDTEGAATATLSASCPVCLTLALARMAVGLAAECCGEGWPVSGELRARMLRALAEAEEQINDANA
jgi:hypothetical protein